MKLFTALLLSALGMVIGLIFITSLLNIIFAQEPDLTGLEDFATENQPKNMETDIPELPITTVAPGSGNRNTFFVTIPIDTDLFPGVRKFTLYGINWTVYPTVKQHDTIINPDYHYDERWQDIRRKAVKR